MNILSNGGFLKNVAPNVNLNSYGHRCKELSDVNLHNYILFVGDNVCLSYHIPIEETFPYIISQQLKTDYYNLSVFNGGIEAVKFNLFGWLSLIKQPPKTIILASEFANALLISGAELNWIKPADYNNSDVKELLDAGNISGFHSSRKALFSNLVKQLNYPIYQVVFPNKEKLVDSSNVINLEYQGDIFDQNGIANLVVDALQVKSMRIRP